MTDAIIEAKARALSQAAEEIDDTALWENRVFVAQAVVAAVTPLIRAAALEEAARVAEDSVMTMVNKIKVAAAIRALKEQP